ncbi:O-acetyltransferase [Phaffia rhodozyma]|uniref:O-acetyltransferase n=1 Tax=Phaffia rhodozyma TaxID=264483 RepID=A0A0F7SU93_PHARH|nr:O-acetyltransferase [Phaffia rhodozyma]
MSSKSSINPNWPSYACTATICLAVLGALMRYFVIDYADKDHCKALLNTGRWMDSDFGLWQPEGCMTANYNAPLIKQCAQSRRIVFIGDSVTRQLFYAMAKSSDSGVPDEPKDSEEKHKDVSLHSRPHDITFDFYWDPFLNSSHTQTLLSTPHTVVPTYTPSHPPPPALLVLGSGLWYLRNPSSGGLAGWESRIDQVFGMISSSRAHGPNSLLADEIVFLPVQMPVVSKLSPSRAENLLPSDIDTMNSDLAVRLSPSSTFMFHPTSPKHPPSSSSSSSSSSSTVKDRGPLPPISLPLAFNSILAPSQTTDGLHFSPKILKTQINLLWNLRCNDVVSKKFPMDKTCCKRYPSVGWLQGLTLLLVVGAVPFLKFLKGRLGHKFTINVLPTNETTVLTLTVFGLCVGLSFLADRTPLWNKENKSFSAIEFALACLATAVGGVLTAQRSEGGKDLGFLNREQTDEWKGWMQILILIYHYLGASKTSGIYNPIRVLVACYLFMTGYGHFTYYYKKAEFGIDRIAMVMVRLNLLPIVLAYVMDTDYISYYFSPLVSFWYLIIYVTMYIGNKYNTVPAFLLPKLALSAFVITLLMKSDDVLRVIFSFLATVFNIQWSPTEWAFRVNLDIWIVYIGMLTAWGYIKLKELGIPQKVWWPTAVKASVGLSVLSLGWFFWFELSQPTKFSYNLSHPYVSMVPVLAFVILRNATPFLRSVSSSAYCFVGQISLETFILQYHLWLAGDTKGILMVLPGGLNWRLLNVAITTVIFIFVSNKVSKATGVLTEVLVGKKKKPRGLPTPATAANTIENADNAVPNGATSNPTSGQAPAEDSIPLLGMGSSTDEPESSPAMDDVVGARQPSSLPERLYQRSGLQRVVDGQAWREKLENHSGWKLVALMMVCWALNLASPRP